MIYVDRLILLFAMIWFHIADDYYLQGILSSFKQKSYWKDLPDKYKYDYKIALLEHSFSNTFMIHIPIFYCYIKGYVYMDVIRLINSFIVTVIIHYNVDDIKINYSKINLVTDQILHIINILAVWIFYTFR